MKIIRFFRNLKIPAVSLFLGDFTSLFLNLLVFRSLLTILPANRFADWEWLVIWLGLCLLLPRNGLEIVAQRSSIRSRRLMRPWLTMVLLTRVLLAIPAMAVFAAIGMQVKSIEPSVVWPLALSLLISAASPDLSARVQGRFRSAGIFLVLRNICFLAFLKTGGQYLTLTLSHISLMFLCSELMVGFAWWMDAYFHQGLPGIKNLRPMLKCSKAIAIRSSHQSFARWLRVLSWNSDAILIGLLIPESWSNIAPTRRLLMTAVIPIANWLGSLGPLMGRIRVQRSFKLTRDALIATSVLSLVIAACAGLTSDFLAKNIAGVEMHNLNLFLAISSLRLFPLVASMVLSASLTAIRMDQASVYPPIAMIVSQILGSLLAALSGNALLAQLLITLSEWLGILCLIFSLNRKYAMPLREKSIKSQAIQRSFYNRPHISFIGNTFAAKLKMKRVEETQLK